jgi:hypothetical protein
MARRLSSAIFFGAFLDLLSQLNQPRTCFIKGEGVAFRICQISSECETSLFMVVVMRFIRVRV